jgi:hypothetical protein
MPNHFSDFGADAVSVEPDAGRVKGGNYVISDSLSWRTVRTIVSAERPNSERVDQGRAGVVRKAPLLLFACLACACFVNAASARQCQDFIEALTILQNNVADGSVEAHTSGCRTEVKYALSENGRGPHTVEHIVYGDQDLPTEYSIQGTSEFGAKINEVYQRQGNAATWRSRADKGQMADARGRLYVVKDFSPYTSAVYARALLLSSHGALATLADGELRITKLQTRTFTATAGRSKFIIPSIRSGSSPQPTWRIR